MIYVCEITIKGRTVGDMTIEKTNIWLHGLERRYPEI
tara:strand:+ start:1061 stop:1171 length:111 start_codon:yes stop_codon:yes gene_type:complete